MTELARNYKQSPAHLQVCLDETNHGGGGASALRWDPSTLASNTRHVHRVLMYSTHDEQYTAYGRFERLLAGCAVRTATLTLTVSFQRTSIARAGTGRAKMGSGADRSKFQTLRRWIDDNLGRMRGDGGQRLVMDFSVPKILTVQPSFSLWTPLDLRPGPHLKVGRSLLPWSTAARSGAKTYVEY